VFKLDVIARELKKVDGHVSLVRDEAGSLGGLATTAGGQARERERLGQLVQRFGSELDSCRGLVRDVIHQCLTEMQKLHIGFTVGEDTLAPGEATPAPFAPTSNVYNDAHHDSMAFMIVIALDLWYNTEINVCAFLFVRN
jgi:hypothetical protein